MVENLSSKPISQLPEEQESTQKLFNTEQTETLNKSLNQRVQEALEKIKSRLKAYLEKDIVKQKFIEGNYEEIYKMIEVYPEDIQEKIKERVNQELIKNPDVVISRFPNKALTERDIFLYSTNENGERKLETQRVTLILEKLINEKDIRTLIKNLDIFLELRAKDNLIKLILSADEKIIQEVIVNASPEIRKLYEDNFEKKYLKKEYIEKAITGAREKGEKADSEEERDKYKKIIEGLEYLKDYEKNVREHCKKMNEQYGIFDEDTVNYMLELIQKYLSQGSVTSKLEKIAGEQNLSVVEILGFLQTQTNEVIEGYRLYSVRHSDEIKHIITGRGDHDKNRPNFRRFISNSERGELNLNFIGGGSTKYIYETGHFGEKYAKKKHGSRNVTYGFLNPEEQINENFGKLTYRSGTRNYRVELKDEVKDRATFTLNQVSSYELSNLIEGTITSWVRLPHISTVLRFYLENNGNLPIDRSLQKYLVEKYKGIDINGGIEVQYHGETGSVDQIQTIMYHHQIPEEKAQLEEWLEECDLPNDIKVISDYEIHHSRKRN